MEWEKIDPNDFIVINIHWTKNKKDSSDLQFKREFDEAVLVEFQSEKLGDQAGNDVETETDYNFIVQRNYQPALNAIVKIAGEYKIEKDIIVHQREYTDGTSWVDKTLYPKNSAN